MATAQQQAEEVLKEFEGRLGEIDKNYYDAEGMPTR